MALPPEIAARFSKLRMLDCAKTLGIEIVSFDAAAREVTITAQGRAEFRNPMGAIQGGFVRDARRRDGAFGAHFERLRIRRPDA